MSDSSISKPAAAARPLRAKKAPSTSVATPVGKYKKREKRAAEILAAARQMLETHGLEGMSVATIAQSVGVSEATVFSYFSTRRDLMSAVIAAWMEPVLDRLEADIPTMIGTRNQLLFFATRHFQELALAPGMHRLIYRELHWDNYYHSTLHRLNQRYTSMVTRIFEDGMVSGELAPTMNIAIERDMLFGALHHIGWRTLMNGRSLDVTRAAEALINQLCDGLPMTSDTVQAAPTDLAPVVARLERIADRLEGKPGRSRPNSAGG